MPMSLGSHLQELQKESTNHLSEAVEDAQRHPGYDDLAIADHEKAESCGSRRRFRAP